MRSTPNMVAERNNTMEQIIKQKGIEQDITCILNNKGCQ
jgi:hypothetical protein